MHEKKILAALRENYRNCTSYEDAGMIHASYITGDSRQDFESEFSTIFIRPNLLRFQIKGPEERQTILQANGESIRGMYSGGNFQDAIVVYPTLTDAIDSSEGVSSGVLSSSFGLLEDFEFYERLYDLKRLPDVVIDDQDCYCISGQFQKHVTVTIWAAKEKNVLKRIEKTIGAEATREAFELARQIAEAEGDSTSWLDIPTCSTVSMIHFKEVTFNNSVTIDAIG